ncbi:glutathione transferase GstA [uncultured Pseudacidovorax sp.]|uniref:glutathione transferase GstA n=1 Tax=uncultured Pseudacidovorax sp. TaxID=679313 RepID=UPI0025FC1470|nr:glutathione transferase GstA [uncultured Pseudacidovorax sp.]
MKLYLSPHTCALAVDVVAREIGVPLDLVWVDVRAKRLVDGTDLHRINPKGQVPALETDDGQVLTEAAVILQYLCDRHGADALLPRALDMARYRVLEWMNFLGSELHKSFTPLFRANTPPEYRLIATENVQRRLAWLDKVLARRDFLYGEGFTAADAHAYAVVSWAGLQAIPLGAWPHLQAYVQRIEARPSVQAARAAERAEIARRASA